jgi:uncharacterized protein
VVLLGSSRLMMQKGLGDALTGRFEIIPVMHWDWTEMQTAFDFTLDQFIWYGGYPGAAGFARDEIRWKNYLLDAIIEPTLTRDVFQMARIDKPVLLRRLLELGCHYSGQILSYTKMLGQLQDNGNTATIIQYLSLLNSAGLLAGIENYHRQQIREKASQPKWQVFNNALLSASTKEQFGVIRQQADRWGRWVESAVGVHLLQASARREITLHYWRENNLEVDFILERNGQLIALEVKSGLSLSGRGMSAFDAAFKPSKTILVGERGLPVELFLATPVPALF